MKILFYQYSLQAGGAERATALFSNYAVQHGDEVTILLKDNTPPFYSLDPRIRLIHLGTSRASRNKWAAIKNNFYGLYRLRSALRACKPDVAICFGAVSNSLLQIWLVKGHRCKLIGSERANPLEWPKSIWLTLAPWISTKCDGFIFQTAGAQSLYPVKTQKKSIILQNSIDSQDFERAEWPWDARAGICAVGRLDPVKCFDDLLRIFAIVHKRFPDVHLDLYGDGPEQPSLEKLANALELDTSLTFCGNNQQMASEYAKHKLFIMTSRSEGMPTVLLEALASGCACVSTNCDFGPSDLIQDGENGFLVPVHDIDAAADRICRLLEDDALSFRFGETAKKVRNTNGLEKIGDAFRTYVKYVISKER